MLTIAFLGTVAAAYLLGTPPSGVIVSRLMGLADPRGFGSGNVGATNVARGGGRAAAALTLLADGGKGAAAVWLASVMAPAAESALFAAAAGLAAVCGHVTSPFLRFRGGRGVATSLTVFLCWHPLAGAAALATWAAVFSLFRYSSAASLAAAPAGAALLFVLAPPPIFWAAALICIIVFLRHASNIRRLLRGEELKVRRGK